MSVMQGKWKGLRLIPALGAVIMSLAATLPGEGRFAVLTDLHVGTSTGSRDLDSCVQDINSLSPVPDFVLVTGDLTEYDMGNLLDSARLILGRLRVPWYAIPGNHELKWSGSAGEKFVKLFGSDRFSFAADSYRFLGFHQGPILRMGEGFVSPEDITWLKGELDKAQAAGEPVILVMHYPLDETITDIGQVLDSLDGHPIVATIHGHGHHNRLSDYFGIPGVMVRSSLSRPHRAGYNVVTIRDNDSLYFAEKNPGTPLKDPWCAISANAKVFHKPDSLTGLVGGSIMSDPLWRIQTGELITAEAVVDGNALIVVTAAGKILRLDPQSGKILWEQRGAGVNGAPAVSGKYVVVGRVDSTIQCLSLTDGHTLWSSKTGNAVVASPRITRGRVFCGSSDGGFYCLKLRSGKVIWRADVSASYVESAPLLTRNKVIFTAWDQTMKALDMRSGKLLWTWRDGRHGMLYSPAACTPLAHDTVVYIVAPDRFLSAVSLNSGKTLWRSRRYTVRENLGIAADGSALFARTMMDTVIAIQPDPKGLKLKWATSGGYHYDINPSPSLSVNGRVYSGTQYGHLLVFDEESGKKLADERISKNIIFTPAVWNDRLIITAQDGSVTAVKLK